MTVEELIHELQSYQPNALVVVERYTLNITLKESEQGDEEEVDRETDIVLQPLACVERRYHEVCLVPEAEE